MTNYVVQLALNCCQGQIQGQAVTIWSCLSASRASQRMNSRQLRTREVPSQRHAGAGPVHTPRMEKSQSHRFSTLLNSKLCLSRLLSLRHTTAWQVDVNRFLLVLTVFHKHSQSADFLCTMNIHPDLLYILFLVFRLTFIRRIYPGWR